MNIAKVVIVTVILSVRETGVWELESLACQSKMDFSPQAVGGPAGFGVVP